MIPIWQVSLQSCDMSSLAFSVLNIHTPRRLSYWGSCIVLRREDPASPDPQAFSPSPLVSPHICNEVIFSRPHQLCLHASHIEPAIAQAEFAWRKANKQPSSHWLPYLVKDLEDFIVKVSNIGPVLFHHGIIDIHDLDSIQQYLGEGRHNCPHCNGCD